MMSDALERPSDRIPLLHAGVAFYKAERRGHRRLLERVLWPATTELVSFSFFLFRFIHVYH